jgi:hypothetical protein
MSDTWDYRIVRQTKDGDEWLSIQEVYYDDETGEPMAHTMDLEVVGDNISGLRKQLQSMLWCLDKDVVDEIESDVSNETMEDRVSLLEQESDEMRKEMESLILSINEKGL